MGGLRQEEQRCPGVTEVARPRTVSQELRRGREGRQGASSSKDRKLPAGRRGPRAAGWTLQVQGSFWKQQYLSVHVRS